MKLVPASESACDRAREAVSLRLDGQLAELGCARLDLHLDNCAACRAYAAEAGASTELLRAAPLEEMSAPIVLPRAGRLSGVRVLQAAAAAAAVALVAALSTVHGVGRPEASSTLPHIKLSPTAGLGRDDEVSPLAQRPSLPARGQSIPQ